MRFREMRPLHSDLSILGTAERPRTEHGHFSAGGDSLFQSLFGTKIGIHVSHFKNPPK
jgi:hypothetical protein